MLTHSLYVNVYSSFIHNCSKLETPQLPLKQRLGEQTDTPPGGTLLIRTQA